MHENLISLACTPRYHTICSRYLAIHFSYTIKETTFPFSYFYAKHILNTSSRLHQYYFNQDSNTYYVFYDSFTITEQTIKIDLLAYLDQVSLDEGSISLTHPFLHKGYGLLAPGRLCMRPLPKIGNNSSVKRKVHMFLSSTNFCCLFNILLTHIILIFKWYVDCCEDPL